MTTTPKRPPSADHILILPTDTVYLDQLEAVQRTVYALRENELGWRDVLNAEKLANHLRVFPEGQFMAYDPDHDRVVGGCTSMRLHYDPAQPFTESWMSTTGDGTLRTHQPDGDWLYGVDNVVLPEYRGRGVGGRLMAARYRLAKRLNLRGMLAGSMPIDYAGSGLSFEQYVAEVVAGARWDTNLSKQIRKGMTILNVIPNYLLHAPETDNYGVAIRWDNPDYRPTRAARPVAPRPQPQPHQRR
jgi:GNAT superfamily N-acetyltransferase